MRERAALALLIDQPSTLLFHSFRLGRQEDAHEYLIALLDAMHEGCLARAPGPKRPPPALAATSLIYSLFGGALRSTLTCAECGAVSTTSEPFLCLSLDVGGADDVQGALGRFTAGETLDGADAWRCPRDARAVRATKALALETCPRVLCLQLKRFSYAHGGRKLSRRVDYPSTLDVAPWTVRGGATSTSAPASTTTYSLYGVLVHSGHSLHCGHYTAYVRAADGRWHVADDATVAPVADRVALSQRAYILFYVADGGAAGRGGSAAAVAPAAEGGGRVAAPAAALAAKAGARPAQDGVASPPPAKKQKAAKKEGGKRCVGKETRERERATKAG
jgi:ubiquitin carboxyl-terminal hydrolase 36/42